MKKKLSNFCWFTILIIFVSFSSIIRTIFLWQEKSEISLSFLLLFKIYLLGAFFDLVTLSYFAFIPLIYYILLPNRFFTGKFNICLVLALYFAFIYTIIFSGVAEWFFWDEFSVRFNFIAVDYLIYTTEVINNILESYPVFPLLLTILFFAAIIFFLTYKKILTVIKEKNDLILRLKLSIYPLLFTLVAFLFLDNSKLVRSIIDNNYAREISYNGVYQLFSAYRNNQLNFKQLYLNKSDQEAFKFVKNKLKAYDPKIKFLSKNDANLWYLVPKASISPEKHYNVILVAVESLSADFMTAFGNQENITPNLDGLTKQSLFFTNLKANGTRTVRGLEALTLSIPPTPGNSIVRRPNNENLFNIGTPFKERGYDLKFIYGGYGYFDNMNYFFANNGFEIVDRAVFDKKEIIFENAWGVSDEDLFNKVIKEADKSQKQGKSFFSFVLTTSNHRPFTYPSGRIEIVSKSGRKGAVKYTDYAIGKLVADAKKKPWFKNTIFIVIADHCAGSAGNTDLPIWRYQIPGLIYAPDIVKPKIFSKNISQIDIAPTLMGIMNFSYKSTFFGQDVLSSKNNLEERAFISTYDKVGYYKNSKLYLLFPKKISKVYDVELKRSGENGSEEKLTTKYDPKILDEAIFYYQSADYLFNNGLLKNAAIAKED